MAGALRSQHQAGVQAGWLPGGRLHLNHGPIDLIIGIDGPGRLPGFARAEARFQGMLEALVAELPALRSPDPGRLTGRVAQAMAAAVAPYRPAFITPMAAVAGAVADAVLAAIVAGPGIARAYVNNGGDIAVHLAAGQEFAVALGTGPHRATLRAGDGVGGIATSGWRGRSQSLGIADAVTVLAPTAAMADAAATMIANAVDLPGHPGILRRPAAEVQADSDLGTRPVTVAVPPLIPAEVAAALDRGASFARDLMARGLVAGAALFLQAETRMTGQTGLIPNMTEPLHG
jgi:ApbE superfamily uncharacterized protein (UPF0280 family)